MVYAHASLWHFIFVAIPAVVVNTIRIRDLLFQLEEHTIRLPLNGKESANVTTDHRFAPT